MSCCRTVMSNLYLLLSLINKGLPQAKSREWGMRKKKTKVEWDGRKKGKENLLVLRIRVPYRWFVFKLHADTVVFSNGKTACIFFAAESLNTFRRYACCFGWLFVGKHYRVKVLLTVNRNTSYPCYKREEVGPKL